MTDVQVIREMTQTFRRLDNRFGGGHGRSAVTNYLGSDVVPLLREGRYRDSLRTDPSTAVAELNQLAGWMAYDVGDSASGRRHLRNAMHLCQDVGDVALAGEMLAGMSHQAAFLRSAVRQRQASGGTSAGLRVGSHGSAWTCPNERCAGLLGRPS